MKYVNTFIIPLFKNNLRFTNNSAAMTLSNIVKKYHKIDTGGTEHHLDISYEYASEYLYEELMLTRKKIQNGNIDEYLKKVFFIIRDMLKEAYQIEKEKLPSNLRTEIQNILGIEENSHKKNQFPLKCTLIPCSVCSESVRNYIKFLYDDRTGNYYMIKIIDWAKKEVTIQTNTIITFDMNDENLYFACYDKGGK